MAIDRNAQVIVVRTTIHRDRRGSFVEVHQAKRLAEMGISVEFVQDNFSRSQKHTIRGLDYQIQHPQGKLVYVTRGAILDVAVDLRTHSDQFGTWTSYRLEVDPDEKDKIMTQIYIPPGFAHGYCVLSDWADVTFKCTDYYHPEFQHCIRWNDPDLGVKWPPELTEPVLSDRQGEHAIAFKNAPYFV
jgi:dTDP-4-dehydrorhamnose 3,5-epimerase